MQELEALTRNVQRTFSEIIEQIPYLPEELQLAVTNIEDPSALCHLIAGALRISTDEKQRLLEQVDVGKRLRSLSEILARELEVIQLGSKIQSQVQSEIEKGQREYYLREQLKAIQDELGEGDERQAEINELRERIEEAGLPEHAPQAGRPRARAGSRSCRPPPPSTASSAPTSSGSTELPWSAETEDDLEHEARPRGARRRPLRPRADQGADPRVPRGAEAEAGLARPDPLLRRPAGRRQDEPRPLDRRAL